MKACLEKLERLLSLPSSTPSRSYKAMNQSISPPTTTQPRQGTESLSSTLIESSSSSHSNSSSLNSDSSISSSSDSDEDSDSSEEEEEEEEEDDHSELLKQLLIKAKQSAKQRQLHLEEETKLNNKMGEDGLAGNDELVLFGQEEEEESSEDEEDQE